MALRGSLTDFSLPDVLQLIALSRKTGLLRMNRDDGAEGDIWFRDGDVFFAQSNWQREKIGTRLIDAQKITQSALDRALDIHAADPERRRIGQILIDEGYITSAVLESFVQEQIQDSVFDLMRWPSGNFAFDILPDVVDEDIGLSVSIENIIMEGSRRLEEWERIKSKVPSMDIVFKMAAAPGEGGFEISLKPAEWNLLLLIDGTRSVAELARETGQTDFEVARIAHGLFSAGLLEVAEEDEVQRIIDERAARWEAAGRTQWQIPASEPPTELRPPFVVPKQEPPVMVVSVGEAAGVPPESEDEVAEPELPQFLTGGRAAPTQGDVAVFEEMLGVLLEGAGVPEPLPPQAPVVPVPEESAVAELPRSEWPETIAEPVAAAEPPVAEEPQAIEPTVETIVEEYVYDASAESEALGWTVRAEAAEGAEPPTEALQEPYAGVESGAAVPTAEVAPIDSQETPYITEAPPALPPVEAPAAVPAEVEAGIEPAGTEAVAGVVTADESGAVETEREGRPSPAPPAGTSAGPARMGLELGGAISDEIAALTGAGRAPRPTAPAERSAESAGLALKRDSRVDRATIEKIIDAISNL